MSKKKTAKKATPFRRPEALLIPLFPPICLASAVMGGFLEWGSALVSLVLLVILWWIAVKKGSLLLPVSITAGAMTLLILFFLLSPLWAVNKGVTVFGAVKFFPALLFTLLLAQCTAEERQRTTDLLPEFFAGLSVFTLLLCAVPAIRSLVFVSGRFGGTFQYPNSYAAILLAGIIIVLCRQKLGWHDWGVLAVLAFFLLLTRSKTVLAMALAALLVNAFAQKEKPVKWIPTAALAAAVLGGGLYVFARGGLSSFSFSTFWGRLLYYRDAIGVILGKPLGLGYMGYASLQGSFQSGVYAIMHVHNDFLQILLDVGWIPALCFLAALVSAFIRAAWRERFVMLIICLHSLFDFDCQFTAVFLVLILAMETEAAEGKNIRVKNGINIAVPVLMLASVYFGLVSYQNYKGKNDFLDIYPWHTQALERKMLAAQTQQEQRETAEKILELTDASPSAHHVRALYAVKESNLDLFITEEEKVLELGKYEKDSYLLYFQNLLNFYREYALSGDVRKMEQVSDKLREIPDMMNRVLEDTSALGWMIDDTPDLELPAEYQAFLDKLGK